MNPKDLTSQLYKAIEEANEVRNFQHWHASSIAECPRAHYFKRQAVEPIAVPTAAKMLRWEAGHLMEKAIRPHVQKIFPDVVSNIRYTSDQLDFTGELDNYSKEAKTIIEVKTVGPRAVRYRKKGEDRHHLRDDQPYLSHRYQQHGYILLLGEEGLPVERIIYLYITLEGLVVPYVETPDQHILANVNERLAVLNQATDENLPDCICKPTHPLWGSCMQFCDYRDADRGVCCQKKLLQSKVGTVAAEVN